MAPTALMKDAGNRTLMKRAVSRDRQAAGSKLTAGGVQLAATERSLNGHRLARAVARASEQAGLRSPAMASIFGRIIDGEIPGRFVWKDDRCVGLVDINPLRPGTRW